MPSFYQEPSHGFRLFQTPEVPGWRPPQRGALGALLGYWAVHRVKPALIAVPTGSVKTAIALATPYLVKSSRTLVVVPSTQLRSQTVSAFQKQEVRGQMGALAGTANPKVLEVKGRLTSWQDCEDADVVVALPQSITPEHYSEGSKASVDLTRKARAHTHRTSRATRPAVTVHPWSYGAISSDGTGSAMSCSRLASLASKWTPTEAMRASPKLANLLNGWSMLKYARPRVSS